MKVTGACKNLFTFNSFRHFIGRPFIYRHTLLEEIHFWKEISLFLWDWIHFFFFFIYVFHVIAHAFEKCLVLRRKKRNFVFLFTINISAGQIYIAVLPKRCRVGEHVNTNPLFNALAIKLFNKLPKYIRECSIHFQCWFYCNSYFLGQTK